MSVDRPDEDVTWAEDPASLVSEPENERQRGWPFGYLPPADQKNWLQRAVGRWIEHLAGSGGTFDSLADASDDLGSGQTASIRVPEEMDAAQFFATVDTGAIPDSKVALAGVVAHDGRRFWANTGSTFDPPVSGLSAFEFRDGAISEVAFSGTDERQAVSIASDGHRVAVVWQDFSEGTPSGDWTLEVYDAAGDLSSTLFTATSGDEDFRLVECDGRYVYLATIEEVTAGNFTVEIRAYDTDASGANPAPDWTASDTWADSQVISLASNGRLIAAHIQEDDDGDHTAAVYLADGSASSGDLFARAQVGRGQAGSVDPIAGDYGSMIWLDGRLYVGVFGGAGRVIEGFSFLEEDTLENPEVEPTTFFKDPEHDGPGRAYYLSTDGEYIYCSVSTDTDGGFSGIERRYVIDPRITAGIAREIAGGNDVNEPFMGSLYRLETNEDSRRADAAGKADGLYLWALGGAPFANQVRIMSTQRHARRFYRADTESPNRYPFHHTLIPEG